MCQALNKNKQTTIWSSEGHLKFKPAFKMTTNGSFRDGHLKCCDIVSDVRKEGCQGAG